MNPAIPNTMRAAAIDHFGGAEEIHIRDLPVPSIGADEILIRVKSAGVGAWDPMERKGKLNRLLGGEANFPYVLDTTVPGRWRRWAQGSIALSRATASTPMAS